MKFSLDANWKTTVSGIGAGISALLATLSTISLTPEAQSVIIFLSPAAKTKVAIGSACAALAFRFWSSLVQKDRDVTGGNVQQDAEGKVATPQEPTPEPPAPALPDSPPETFDYKPAAKAARKPTKTKPAV